MSDPVTAFLEHFSVARGRFHLHVPNETPYEEMVRKYEANDPHMLHVMKLVLDIPMSAPTARKELVLWKQRAADERNALRSMVNVRHTLSLDRKRESRATEEMVELALGELGQLYQQICSAKLYADKFNPDSGFMIFPVSAMAGELQCVIDWFDGDEYDYEETSSDGKLELNGVPPWIHQTVVFAGAAQSADKFLLACAGPYKGYVFEFDHDMLGFRQVATSLPQFLDLLRSSPLTVAKWIGIHEATAYEHAA